MTSFKRPFAMQDRTTRAIVHSLQSAAIHNDIPRKTGTVRCSAPFPRAQVIIAMPDQKTLIETLRSTSTVLLALRKAISVGGHIEAMAEIDTLLAVTLAETNRRSAAASH